MGKAPAEQFYWNDWSRDLEEHPLEIEGAWIRICCKLWFSETRGEAAKTLEQWAKILGTTTETAQRILTYIGEEKIGNIDNSLCEENVRTNGKITVTCRRMVRDEKERKSNRERQRRHYERKKRKPNGQSNGNLTPPSSSSSSTSTSNTKNPTSDSDEFRLGELLFSLINERHDKFKKPNLQTWAKHIDRMIRLDSRDPPEIEAVIKWCQKDPFWQNNILSTAKLREKYDQLVLRMKTRNQGSSKHDNLSSKEYTGTPPEEIEWLNDP